VIDEDAAHHLRGHGEEVRAVVPRGAALVDEAEIELVHQRRRLQGVAGALGVQVPLRDRAQRIVDEAEELVACFLAPFIPLTEKLGDFGHWTDLLKGGL
jgi:hypothetical protein